MKDASAIERFAYERPPDTDGKVHARLVKTEFIKADVQLVGANGNTNLHSHSGTDAIWYVLKGRARFYGGEEEPVIELGPNEGVLIPHSTPYWFESAGDVDLEVLHVTARTKAKNDKRVDFTARRIKDDRIIEDTSDAEPSTAGAG